MATAADSGPLRIVFLDIDGVICCNTQCRLEQDKMQIFKTVHSATGCKVVLSTDWRKYPAAKKQLIGELKQMGIQTIGQTPTHSPWARPKEITAWIANFDRTREPANQLRYYVAVDDRMLLEEPGGNRLKGHFVRTMPRRGLTQEKATMMIRILMENEVMPLPPGPAGAAVANAAAAAAAAAAKPVPPEAGRVGGVGFGRGGGARGRQITVPAGAGRGGGLVTGRVVRTGGPQGQNKPAGGGAEPDAVRQRILESQRSAKAAGERLGGALGVGRGGCGLPASADTSRTTRTSLGGIAGAGPGGRAGGGGLKIAAGLGLGAGARLPAASKPATRVPQATTGTGRAPSTNGYARNAAMGGPPRKEYAR